jgi:hypothetical protein
MIWKKHQLCYSHLEIPWYIVLLQYLAAKHHQDDFHFQESEAAVPLIGAVPNDTQVQNKDEWKLLFFAFVAFLCACVSGYVGS